MKINIQTIDFKASKSLEKFVDSKISKLSKKYADIIRADISLKRGPANVPGNKYCSLYISHSGENQYLKKSGDSYEESIVKAIDGMDKIFERLKRKKNKLMK